MFNAAIFGSILQTSCFFFKRCW